MFRKGFSRGRSFGRPMSRPKAYRTFARKKTDWVISLNNICEPDGGEFPPCQDWAPPDAEVIPLLQTGNMVGGYNYAASGQDSVICRRIKGQLTFNLGVNSPSTFSGQFLMRLGLKITESSSQGNVVPSYNPLSGDETNGGDYADARWLRMWERSVGIEGDFTQLPPPVIPKLTFRDCSTGVEAGFGGCLVSGAGCIGSLPVVAGVCSSIEGSIGQGVKLGTECFTCEDPIQSITVKHIAKPFVVNIDVRRPIRLRDNQNLALFWGAVSVSTGNPSVIWEMYGGIRCKLEK